MAEKYISALEAAGKISNLTSIPLKDLVDIFANIPAADVLPGVDYCNAIKCVYRDICDEPCYEAAHEEELKQKMFFCSNGEPKEE